MSTTTQSDIILSVTLDEKKHPIALAWQAEESGVEGKKPCEAVMLSIWDTKSDTSYRIDLWTDKMLVNDMKKFVYENLASLADTYERATSDSEGATELRVFSESFGKRTGIKS